MTKKTDFAQYLKENKGFDFSHAQTEKFDSCINDLIQEFAEWVEHTNNSFEDEDVEEEGYDSVEDMIEEGKKEFEKYVKIKIEDAMTSF